MIAGIQTHFPTGDCRDQDVEHYPTDADGKLVMHPAQALETWWDCTNPMPELAGLYALTARLQALPEDLTTPEQRQFWKTLQEKIYLLPAWPKDWNVRFKLHAPHRTTVECEFRDGRIVDFVVTPAERRKDVVVVEPAP